MDSTRDDNGVALLAKLIPDLDSLIQALRSGLAVSKPWQRSLHIGLADADQKMEVLRMTIVMKRPEAEALEAAARLHAALSAGQLQVTNRRAEAATKAAMLLALALAKQIRDAYASANLPTG